ncbi:sensor histidine kinase [Micromonospora sp. CB01531]|uniref:sensor histidine kinase n=1 Tax=Micromonospora sp. CB01531 TaxID=1718947 RepID=UPI000938FFA3|nr:ATP-binding protein [Micromonospora sp. CB01531]OKI56399.1 hypothetical protein A6A27_30500 [Micromonospora sp. CB01531]
MLGLLRGERAQLALKPQPGTADLAELVDHMAEIGLPVELTVEGTARPLPPGVELTVYRVVQEALTNALKHAAPTRAHVGLRYDDQSVRVIVRDAGRTDGSGGADANQSLTVLREALRLAFPDRPLPAATPAAALAPRQRRLVEVLSRSPNPWLIDGQDFGNVAMLVDEYGLPDSREALLAYLARLP